MKWPNFGLFHWWLFCKIHVYVYILCISILTHSNNGLGERGKKYSHFLFWKKCLINGFGRLILIFVVASIFLQTRSSNWFGPQTAFVACSRQARFHFIHSLLIDDGQSTFAGIVGFHTKKTLGRSVGQSDGCVGFKKLNNLFMKSNFFFVSFRGPVWNKRDRSWWWLIDVRFRYDRGVRVTHSREDQTKVIRGQYKDIPELIPDPDATLQKLICTSRSCFVFCFVFC